MQPIFAQSTFKFLYTIRQKWRNKGTNKHQLESGLARYAIGQGFGFAPPDNATVTTRVLSISCWLYAYTANGS